MLTSPHDPQRSHCVGENDGRLRQIRLGLVLLLIVSSVQLAEAQTSRYHAPRRVQPQSQPSHQITQTQHIVQTQGVAENSFDRPRDPRIVDMPTVEDNFSVVHHRSQLVVTSKRIARMAIADPSVIEVAPYSETEISVIGLALGSTTLTLWFEDDIDPLIYLVNVVRDPSIEEQRRLDFGRLERKIALLFPNSKVYLIPMSGKVIVKGQAAGSEESAKILQIIRGEVLSRGDYAGLGNNAGGGYIAAAGANAGVLGNGLNSDFIVNMLQVPGEFQVMLRVRIAELNRSQLRRKGVDLTYLIDGGRHVISTAITQGVPTLSGIFENGEIGVLIDALATNGTATILSEPALTVLSGRSASFLSGGEFAVPTIVGIGGAQGQQTSFRGFGTSLLVTPTVTDGDLIRLQIMPEFSGVSTGNTVQGIPGLESRRLQTTVELREGQTIVLGGLLSRQRSTDVARIPLLGDIPVIGPTLFSSQAATEDETELLILVTPEIVRPMEPDEVPPMPGFYVTQPLDKQLYFHNMTEGAPDQNVYQLPPWGNKVGYAQSVGYFHHNPAPAAPQYAPVPTGNQAYDPAVPPQYQQQAPVQQQPQQYQQPQQNVPPADLRDNQHTPSVPQTPPNPTPIPDPGTSGDPFGGQPGGIAPPLPQGQGNFNQPIRYRQPANAPGQYQEQQYQGQQYQGGGYQNQQGYQQQQRQPQGHQMPGQPARGQYQGTPQQQGVTAPSIPTAQRGSFPNSNVRQVSGTQGQGHVIPASSRQSTQPGKNPQMFRFLPRLKSGQSNTGR